MKKYLLYILLSNILLTTSNNIFSQATKIITESNYSSDFGGWVSIKKSVINKSPYLQHGKTEYWVESTLVMEETYKNGELDGEKNEYLGILLGYPYGCKGKSIKTTNYKEGKMISIKKYSCEGSSYFMEKETLNGEPERYIEYYSDGTKKSSLSDIGLCTKWHENGKKEEEYTLDGRFNNNGTYSKWFDDGSIEVIGQHINGKRTGQWKSYYSNGQLKEDTKYDNEGNVLGRSIEYYENGKIKADITYYKDKGIVAKSIEYYENGKIKNYLEADTTNGRNGYYGNKLVVEYDYYSNGNLARECIVGKNGGVVNEEKLYYNDSTYNNTLLSGKKFGLWKEYFAENPNTKTEINDRYTDSSNAKFYRVIKYNYSGDKFNAMNTFKEFKDYYITGEKYFEGEFAEYSHDISFGIWYSKDGQAEFVKLKNSNKIYTSLEYLNLAFKFVYIKEEKKEASDHSSYISTSYPKGKQLYQQAEKVLKNISNEKEKIAVLDSLVSFAKTNTDEINKAIKNAETDEQIVGVILYYNIITQQINIIFAKISNINLLFIDYKNITKNELLKLNEEYNEYNGLWYSKVKQEKGNTILNELALLEKNIELLKKNDNEIATLKQDYENKLQNNNPNKQLYKKGSSLLSEQSELLEQEGNSTKRIEIGNNVLIPSLKKLISLSSSDNVELNLKLKDAKTSDEIKKLLEL